MICPGCGRWSPPDPETGYDADEFCPDCERQNEDDLNAPTDGEDDLPDIITPEDTPF